MLEGGIFNGDFENQFSELRYMTCTWVSQEFSAINFHPSNLLVLQLMRSPITEEWAGWSQFKVPSSLYLFISIELSHAIFMFSTKID